MQKLLCAALCASALTFGLSGTAQADESSFTPLQPSLGGTTLTQTYAISNNDFSDSGTFDDVYLYENSPSYSLDEYIVKGSGLDFTSVSLTQVGGASVLLTGTFSDGAFDLRPNGVLASGLWELEIVGTYGAGASYSGALLSTSTDAPPLAAVPEPASWGLLLAGLAAMFALSGRRSTK